MGASPSKSQIFWQRLGSTLVLWTVTLLALFAPNPTVANLAFLLFTAGLGILGIREFGHMVAQREYRVHLVPMGIAGILYLTLHVIQGWRPEAMPGAIPAQDLLSLVIVGLFLCLASLKLWSSGSISLAAIGLSFFGWFYVFGLLGFIALIYYLPEVPGAWWLLYFILVTKFSDLGAYVVGSLCGKHKMAPKISPGKTWEGFAGALAVSTLVSLITIYTAGESLAPLRGIHAVALGLLLSSLAVVGDLIESLMKRETGVKDSGMLIPGIGGCLDLLDSLLFNAPIFYLYCRLVVFS